jgi:hypothetical protein
MPKQKNLETHEQMHARIVAETADAIAKERAEKASGLWAKRVYKRDGTVPTQPEWRAWVERYAMTHEK